MSKTNFNDVVASTQRTFDNPPGGTEKAQVRTEFFVKYPPDQSRRDGEVPRSLPAIRRTMNLAGGLVIAHLADISTLPGALHPSGNFLNPLTSQPPENAKLWLQISIGNRGMQQPWANLNTAFDDYNGKELDEEIAQRNALSHMDGEAALADAVTSDDPLLAPLLEHAEREDEKWEHNKLWHKFTVDDQIDQLRGSLNVWALCPNQRPEMSHYPMDRRHGAHVDGLRNARDIARKLGLLTQPLELSTNFIMGALGTTSALGHSPEEAQKLVDVFHR